MLAGMIARGLAAKPKLDQFWTNIGLLESQYQAKRLLSDLPAY